MARRSSTRRRLGLSLALVPLVIGFVPFLVSYSRQSQAGGTVDAGASFGPAAMHRATAWRLVLFGAFLSAVTAAYVGLDVAIFVGIAQQLVAFWTRSATAKPARATVGDSGVASQSEPPQLLRWAAQAGRSFATARACAVAESGCTKRER